MGGRGAGRTGRTRRWGASLALAAGGALVAACGHGGPGEAPRWNVVLVLVDTLRADHLESYGYPRPTSPALRAFDRTAFRFENAVSQAGCTFPSVNSLLTSRYPAVFFEPGLDRGIPEGIPPLAEILDAEGYTTLAVSASSIVRATPSQHNRGGGYGRGFATFDEECLLRDAACVNGRAFELLNTAAEPFFLYLHYMEPHGPYQPPDDHPRRFAPRRAPGVQGFVRRGSIIPLFEMVYGDRPMRFSPRDLEYLVALYDEEVAYFDEQFRRLVLDLRRRGLWERTIVAVVADHGEELMDHGEITHCRSMIYETVLATPFWLRLPWAPEGGRRDQLVQNLDLVPTLLDYLALTDRGYRLAGRSLRRTIEEDRPVNRYAFSSQGFARAVRDARFKLVHDLQAGSFALYDLDAGPLAEEEDVQEAHPEAFAELREVLERWILEHEGEDAARRGVRWAEEIDRKLRAVGYLP